MSSSQNFLVTGGRGFIGKHLVLALTRLGYSVTSVDLKPIDTTITTPLVQQYQCDVNDFDFENSEYDVIYHLAAIPRVGIGIARPQKVLNNNISSTTTVLDYARSNGKTKVVFASSSSVGAGDPTLSPYTMSKKIGEQLMELYEKTFGVKTATVRLFNVYGPGEADYGPDSTLIRQCQQAYLNNTVLEMRGDGSIERDFTHVKDVIYGLIIISKLFDTAAGKSFYELGAAKPVRIKDIISCFVAPENIHQVEQRKADCQKTESDRTKWPFGWSPKMDIVKFIVTWKKYHPKS